MEAMNLPTSWETVDQPPPQGRRVRGTDPPPRWYGALMLAFAQVRATEDAHRRAVEERNLALWAAVRGRRATQQWLARNLGLSNARVHQMVCEGERVAAERSVGVESVAERVYGR